MDMIKDKPDWAVSRLNWAPGKEQAGSTCRIDPYSPAKITKNRAHLGNRRDWAVFGSNITTVAPDGILRQGQQLPTPNRPLEVTVVVVMRKESRIDSIYKKTARTVRKTDSTGQSGYFFVLG
ncbi:hypothetical protein CRG98_007505 [Punica granatum]|uniref:Uncharacterized protein n=1 Tax=Punica granatum TaxID=22663 RepID=A0A2I0KUG6_PUNGR|nr:hypothetical protein CRG98_007505 [Punica granatum]